MFDFRALRLESGQCDTLVDIGANKGQFLAAALDYFRPRRWVAIEMLPDLAQHLRDHPQFATGEGLVLNCAVGESAGRRTVLRSVYSEASSLLRLDPRASEWYGIDLTQHESGDAQVRSLDAICEEYEIDRIDVLKIDVQGYEREVIRGAKRMLGRTANLIIEVEFVRVYQGQALAGEIQSELEACGFSFRQYLSEYRNSTGQLLHGDALFRRPVVSRKYRGR